MPIDRTVRPLRFAIVVSSAKCGEGGSSDRRDAHQARDRGRNGRGRRREKRGIRRRDAAFLRLLAGVDLNEQARFCGPALAISFASASARHPGGRRSRSRRTAPPPLAPCWIAAGRSGAARHRGSARAGPAICPSPPGRGSRRRPAARQPAPADAVAPKVFDTATSWSSLGGRAHPRGPAYGGPDRGEAVRRLREAPMRLGHGVVLCFPHGGSRDRRWRQCGP